MSTSLHLSKDCFKLAVTRQDASFLNQFASYAKETGECDTLSRSQRTPFLLKSSGSLLRLSAVAVWKVLCCKAVCALYQSGYQHALPPPTDAMNTSSGVGIRKVSDGAKYFVRG